MREHEENKYREKCMSPFLSFFSIFISRVVTFPCFMVGPTLCSSYHLRLPIIPPGPCARCYCHSVCVILGVSFSLKAMGFRGFKRQGKAVQTMGKGRTLGHRFPRRSLPPHPRLLSTKNDAVSQRRSHLTS